jgi:hypothetical protein
MMGSKSPILCGADLHSYGRGTPARRNDRRKRLKFLARRDRSAGGFNDAPLLVGQFDVWTVRGQGTPRLLVGEPAQQRSRRAQVRSFGSHKSREHSATLMLTQ